MGKSESSIVEITKDKKKKSAFRALEFAFSGFTSYKS